MKIIGKKWSILILRDLFDGKKRFSQILLSLDDISPRTLSLRLKEFEKNKIVTKKVYKEIPLHVEYSLTKKGESLHEIIKDLRCWGEEFG
ncbi:MAG: winged helix-turn-helix transcriptional regulator [Patescibacteria group bacterium]